MCSKKVLPVGYEYIRIVCPQREGEYLYFFCRVHMYWTRTVLYWYNTLMLQYSDANGDVLDTAHTYYAVCFWERSA